MKICSMDTLTILDHIQAEYAVHVNDAGLVAVRYQPPPASFRPSNLLCQKSSSYNWLTELRAPCSTHLENHIKAASC